MSFLCALPIFKLAFLSYYCHMLWTMHRLWPPKRDIDNKVCSHIIDSFKSPCGGQETTTLHNLQVDSSTHTQDRCSRQHFSFILTLHSCWQVSKYLACLSPHAMLMPQQHSSLSFWDPLCLAWLKATTFTIRRDSTDTSNCLSFSDRNNFGTSRGQL